MAAFGYNIFLTGDCSNTCSGAVRLTASGGTPPYYFDWGNCIYDDFRTGLCAGNYDVRVNDSTSPVNNEFTIGIYVSSGFCLTITSLSGTSCGGDNGSVTITGNSYTSDVTYYLKDLTNNVINSNSSSFATTTFNNIPQGIYYIDAVDGGGCSASTETFVISSSTAVNFGFYVVNTTSCDTTFGRLYITGITGTAPFTYNWSNGSSQSYITGLTAGSYSVTATSFDGCSVVKNATVGVQPQLSLGGWNVVQPSCFASDGIATLTISGGTGPYYYSSSTGVVVCSYLTSYTFEDIPNGIFSVYVQDGSLCNATFSTPLQAPGTINSVTILPTNSSCGNNNGSVNLSIVGGTPPYTYRLSAGTTLISATTTFSTSVTYDSLGSGNYTARIIDTTSCSYSDTFTITNTQPFSSTTSVTATTCGYANGYVLVTKTSGGTPPYDYRITNDNFTQSFLNQSTSAVTFNGIPDGYYTVSISDDDGCTINRYVVVSTSNNLNYFLYPTNCGTGSNGGIDLYISSGVPPFTVQWSSNCSGKTGTTKFEVTGLTAGTYSVLVTDASGCSQTQTTTITCRSTNTSAITYNYCSGVMTKTGGSKLGIDIMTYEGYSGVTDGYSGCVLSSMYYTVEVVVDTTTGSTVAYYSTSLTDIMPDNVYFATVRNLLFNNPNISDVTIDETTGEITVKSDKNDNLLGKNFDVNLSINFNVNCNS
jgi:hypothetical protein